MMRTKETEDDDDNMEEKEEEGGEEQLQQEEVKGGGQWEEEDHRDKYHQVGGVLALLPAKVVFFGEVANLVASPNRVKG